MILRLLLSTTFVVTVSAQVSFVAGTTCSPDETARNHALRVNRPPISTRLLDVAATNVRGKCILMIIIPEGTADSDVSEALIHVFGDRSRKPQNWQVPAVEDAVFLKDVSLADSSSAGLSADYTDSRGTVTVPIPISDVTGLAGALSAVNSSMASLNSTVATLNTTVSTLNSQLQSLPPVPAFVDSEVPVGAIDGSNTTFTMSTVPSPQSSIILAKNGMQMSRGSDYSVSGTTIVFATGAIPQPGDTIAVSYRH